jgi:DNA modification methylase
VIWPEDFINKIICGDCLEVMKEMPGECIDFCIADPPWNVGKDYEKFNDKKEENEYWNWLKERLSQIFRVLKKNSRFYCFHGDKQIFKLKPLCEELGFNYHQTLIWHKRNLCSFRSGRITGDWHFMHESILLFHKGKRSPMITGHQFNCFSVFIYPSPQSNFKGGRDHPAQKPLNLMKHIISRTRGDLILFPFLGSGVDTRAAKDLKRNYIGIEINPDYCKIAEERLAQGVL